MPRDRRTLSRSAVPVADRATILPIAVVLSASRVALERAAPGSRTVAIPHHALADEKDPEKRS
jgi:hypothetical protein